MTEKISIFDVEISCIKAKEAMMQAIGFMKGDSINTIELVSMESLMKEHENPEWKKKVSMQDLVLPGSVEILEAAKTDDARLLRDRCRQDPWNSECSQWLRGRLYFISPSIAGTGRFY